MNDYEKAREAYKELKFSCHRRGREVSFDDLENLKWPDGSPMVGVIASKQPKVEVYKDMAERDAYYSTELVRKRGWYKLAKKGEVQNV